jgi:hypothetical protein
MARVLTATAPQTSKITRDYIKILWGARHNKIRGPEWKHGAFGVFIPAGGLMTKFAPPALKAALN